MSVAGKATHGKEAPVHPELVRDERLQALEQMASGITHDFNNALQPIMLAASMLTRENLATIDRSLIHEYIEIILKATRQASDTIQQLKLFYSLAPPQHPENIDISLLLKECMERFLTESAASSPPITRTDLSRGDCIIRGDRQELTRCLSAVLDNAKEACGRADQILVNIDKAPDGVLIRIADSGRGMPPATLARCIEPFFTTKSLRGSGLGLSIAYGVVRRHNGSLSIESQPGKGTTVSILLPSDQMGKRNRRLTGL